MTAVSGKRALVAVLVILVAFVVARGLLIIGPPGEERTRRLDARRIEDLQRISRAAEVFHGRHQRLPETLAELGLEPGLSSIAQDPVSGQPYPYRIVDANRYELCSAFDRETADRGSADFWSHGAGRQCFTLKVKETTPR